MELWSRKPIGIGGLQLMPGWQEVSKEQLDALSPRERKYLEDLREEGLVREDADDKTGPKPRHIPNVPPTAKALVHALQAAKTLKALDALNADDDNRSTVATAYTEALERIRG